MKLHGLLLHLGYILGYRKEEIEKVIVLLFQTFQVSYLYLYVDQLAVKRAPLRHWPRCVTNRV